jgi:hypothetical protein
MAKKKSAEDFAHILHKAILICFDVMVRLSAKDVCPNDPEPKELAELCRAARALPEVTDDPFIGTSSADLPVGLDGTSYHDAVRRCALDWVKRLPEKLADARRRKDNRVMGMPLLTLDPERFRAALSLELNRVKANEATAGRRKPQSVRRNSKAESRDKWIYEQCRKGTPHDQIVFALKKIAFDRGWKVVSSKQRIQQVGNEYADKHGLERPAPRQNL